MERPDTGMAFEAKRHLTIPRIVGFALVIALHVGFVYALVTGLTMHVALQLPQELLAEVVAVPQPTPQPPPLTPSLAQPSLPTVAPPLIRIDQPQASDHSITAYVGLPMSTPGFTQPISGAPASTPAMAIEKTHTIPPYPMSARRLNQQGLVRLNLTVSPDGSVSDASIIVSSGTSALDEVALAWVKSHWRYKPATKDGHVVAATVRAIVVFDLKNA
jgi:periplasmic protein TonB